MPSQKIQRWIDLLAALLRRRFPASLEELAREVPGYDTGQTKAALRRTFERDKDELRTFGIPIETVTAPEGEVAGYRLQPQHFYLPYLTLRSEGGKAGPSRVDRFGYRTLKQLSFEPEELAAVVDAATRVRQLGDPLLAEHAESALRKLAVDLPVDAANPDPARLVPPRAKTSPELLATLGQALEDRKQVTFDYHTMVNDSTARRSVEPFGLFFLNQHWYLVACTPGEEPAKNYRLSRMRALKVNPARPGTRDYEIPSAFNLRDHARSRQAWELGAADTITAIVSFRTDTGATTAARRLGEVVDGEQDTRRFRVRRTDAFLRWLLSFGGELVPVSTPELVQEYRTLVSETLAHHMVRPSARPPDRPSARPSARPTARPT